MNSTDAAAGNRVHYWIGAALCFATGAGVILTLMGIFAVEKYAPDWVLWIAAAAFVLFGIMLLVMAIPWLGRRTEFSERIRLALGLALLACFVIIANWAAFGSEERRGKSSFSLFGVGAAGRSGDFEARLVMGTGAVLLDLIVVGGIVREVVRSRLRRRERRAPPGPGAGVSSASGRS